METWRFLVSLTILLVVWAVLVSLIDEPPGPQALFFAAILAAVALYVSDLITRRKMQKE